MKAGWGGGGFFFLRDIFWDLKKKVLDFRIEFVVMITKVNADFQTSLFLRRGGKGASFANFV